MGIEICLVLYAQHLREDMAAVLKMVYGNRRLPCPGAEVLLPGQVVHGNAQQLWKDIAAMW